MLALAGGSILESRWDGQGWATLRDGQPQPGSPWESLEVALPDGPWVGAASYELACWEAGLPFRPPGTGALGMHWRGVRAALSVRDGQAELWGFEDRPPGRPDFGGACALRRARASLTPLWDEDTHRAAVEAIRKRIRNGDFYVANLCVPFEGPFEGDAVTAALAAFRHARPPYGAYMDLGGPVLLCLSMERLLSKRGRALRSEPIKGTVPLLGDPDADAQAAEALRADPKERAEHAMIVDLIRNDLGRVSIPGSVSVPRFREVERFPTVQHLVSRVESAARPGLGLAELMRAMVPGGSVTGAPKRAVCAHLAEAEAAPRGFYCGALGWLGSDGSLDLALPIRTAILDGGKIRYWAGGGITLKSGAAKEWRELAWKTRALDPFIR
jgi:anthranilate/para-aminobenzoate synthase component I